jgi:hypothetical protein
MQRRGWLKNGNPPGDFTPAARCGAKTRQRTPCPGPAMRNGRCRMHGGASTGRRTAAIFASTTEAQCVLDAWRQDYNHVRPHSALQDRTPVEMGTIWVDSREARESTAVRKDRVETEIAGRLVTIPAY